MCAQIVVVADVGVVFICSGVVYLYLLCFLRHFQPSPLLISHSKQMAKRCYHHVYLLGAVGLIS